MPAGNDLKIELDGLDAADDAPRALLSAKVRGTLPVDVVYYAILEAQSALTRYSPRCVGAKNGFAPLGSRHHPLAETREWIAAQGLLATFADRFPMLWVREGDRLVSHLLGDDRASCRIKETDLSQAFSYDADRDDVRAGPRGAVLVSARRDIAVAHGLAAASQ